MPLKDYISANAEWEEERLYGESGFTEDWNKRNKKGLKIVEDKADIQIVVTIHGIKEMAAYRIWWEIAKGDVKFIDASGATIVSFDINEYYESCGGFKAMKLRNRIKETMEGLSESILYFAKKANK